MTTIEELEDEIASLSAEITDLEVEIEEFDALLIRQGALLTETVNALKGPPPELTTWSHHDVAELARQAVQRRTEMGQHAMRLSHIILMGATLEGCNWATDGSVASFQAIYDETLRLVREKAWNEGHAATAENPYSR